MRYKSITAFMIAGSLATVACGADRFAIPQDVTRVLDSHCVSCHGPKKQKGKVRLDTIAKLGGEARIDLLNNMRESVRFREMPPEDAKKQPAEAQRKLLDDWLGGVLSAAGSSKFEDKLKKPEYGNYVDHEKLFSGEYKDVPGFTDDRRWLISEYIFNAKFQRMLKGRTTLTRKSKRVTAFGGTTIRGLSLTNPFLLPQRSGVRYYATTDLTGGHVSSMLTNAQKTSQYMTDYLAKRDPKYIPAITKIMAMEDQHAATLASRRKFLETHIARLCQEYYGAKHQAMLPAFVPVKLTPPPKLKKGEKYKKAPIHVAQNMLKGLGADAFVYQALQDPAHKDKSDEAFKAYCERAWFYYGDHERKIQGRMTLLRDYLPEFRKSLEKNKRRYKPLVYKPLGDGEMAAIRAGILRHRKKGDRHNAVIERCMAEWTREFEQARKKAGPPSDELLLALVEQLFSLILERAPEKVEADEHLALSKAYVSKLGNLKGVQKLIQTLILSSEFVYRQEFGVGQADAHGRRMLSPRDASYAIAYALTDQSPDAELAKAAAEGRLNTREDYRRQVERILKRRDVYFLIDTTLSDRMKNNVTDAPIRKLRFFREFFGYPKALGVFKDEKRFGGDRLGNATKRLLNEADRLVEYILEKDQNVFEELLATDKFYLYHDGDNERMQAASDRIKRIYAYFKDKDWKNFKKEDLVKHRDFLKEVKMRSVDPDNLNKGNRQGKPIQLFKKSMETITARLDKGQKEAAPFDLYRGYGNDFMSGYNVAKFFSISLDNWDYATVQPAPIPNYKGMLTHPAWLIAHAQNTETDPVIRGKWVREKLLAGTIPDVPITVDAAVPEDHNKTLRDRLVSATENEYCWKCHRLMNPLGYAFEAYDDFGRFRKKEPLEYEQHLIKKGPEKGGNHLTERRNIYKTLPVDSTGRLDGTGDKALDGDVAGAIDLAGRLAKSRRVRQSIIRYAFRYFMGRNERLSDSKTLIEAERAYASSGGSFDAVIVSLLTSDSFIYRKAIED